MRPTGSRLPRQLVTADVVALALSFIVSQLLLGPGLGSLDGQGTAVLVLVVVPGWLILAAAHGLYSRDAHRVDHSTADEATMVFYLTTAGAWVFFAGVQIAGVEHPRFGRFLAFWALAIAAVLAGRALTRAIHLRRHHRTSRALIVGAGEVGQRVATKLRNHPEYGIEVAGFIDDDPSEAGSNVAGVPVLGGSATMASIIRERDVDRVIFAFSSEPLERELQQVDVGRHLGVYIDVVPRLFETLGPGTYVHAVEGLPLIGTPPVMLDPGRLAVKRAFDLVAACLGVLILAPVYAAVALIIKLDSPGPVLYRHERIGRFGHPLRVCKFRTMHLEHCRGESYGGADAEDRFQQLMEDPELKKQFTESQKLTSDPRVSRVGGFLRRTSLDELPQLFNVIRGDLSLVGPRAITSDELHRYGRQAKVLLATKPGITGFWQINGRSAISYDERVWLDMAYVENWSLALDLMILAKTFRVILSSQGAY
jgi:exopolysaccharide biosynthesis polyprenyl glycosylphosphotransferase